MKIIAVLAMTENLLIGDSGGLPWDIPEDLQHFQKITKGEIVIMGKKTFDSLPERFRPLPKRRNIILSRNCQNNIESYTSIENCIGSLEREGVERCYIIGGSYIFNEFFKKYLITHVECTLIDGDYTGNIYIDEWREDFTLKYSETFSAGTFCSYTKNS